MAENKGARGLSAPAAREGRGVGSGRMRNIAVANNTLCLESVSVQMCAVVTPETGQAERQRVELRLCGRTDSTGLTGLLCAGQALSRPVFRALAPADWGVITGALSRCGSTCRPVRPLSMGVIGTRCGAFSEPDRQR